MGAACCAGSGASTLRSTGGGSPLSYFIGIAALVLDTKLAPVVLTTLAAALAVPYVMLVLLTPKQLHISPEECLYMDAAHPTKRKQLPSVSQPAETQLTVVVPAYNEERRLGKMLDDCIDWLESLRREHIALAHAQRNSSAPRRNGKAPEKPTRAAHPAVQLALERPLLSYEVLIVDDGSRDNTHDVAVEYACKKALPLGAEIRITGLQQNRGKGAAVRHGVMHARGALILFADADGATRFSELGELAREMLRIATPAGHGIVVGSRAHLVTSEAVVKRSALRNFLMRCFHLLLSVLMRPPSISGLLHHAIDALMRMAPAAVRPKRTGAAVVPLPMQPEIKDTQCGFKLFTRQTAQLVFPFAHIDRWIFDVELLLLAEMASRASEQAHALRTDTVLTGGDPLLSLPLPIAEVAVHWTEIEGSKISLLRDSIKMGTDLLVIRMNYALGRWQSPPSVYALPQPAP